MAAYNNPIFLASIRFALIAFALSLTSEVLAQQSASETHLGPFLQSYCNDCHSGSDAEAGLDFESLSVDLTDAELRRRWIHIYDRVDEGEMPPTDASQPSSGDLNDFLSRVGSALRRADQVDREVVLRRLTRAQYELTVEDVFGIAVDVSRVLVDDAKTIGFDHVGSRLSLSSDQMTRYLDAAHLVLDQIFGPDQSPRSIDQSLNFATSRRGAGESERKLQDGVVLFSGAKHLPLYDLSMPTPGLYDVRVTIGAEQSNEPVVMHVTGGNTGRIASHTVGFFEAPPGKRVEVRFQDRTFERGDNLGIGFVGGVPFWSVNATEYKGPGLFIGDIHISGPIDEWTSSRKRLLRAVHPDRGTLADARTILLTTARRLFRRRVRDSEIAPYTELASVAMEQDKGFIAALRAGLTGLLCAPEFLFLEEKVTPQQSVDDYALASRLSYFLWNSAPDNRLLNHADNGTLREPAVLKAEVERLLTDPKSERWVESFTGQWLRLHDIDFTVPDRRLYPEYDLLLRDSMLKETHAFFREILDEDLAVQNFIDSDFLMLNGPLAEFYGIEGVKGLPFRRVPRPAGSVRGGVITQASVLKVSADGTRTSPVLRGVWLLNHFYATPPLPPPPSVSTAQPDIRGATTIREELAKHRSDPNCNRCHRKIDPPGFALESFDVLGGHRQWYRRREGKWIQKQKHPFSEATVQYRRGPDVDSSGRIPSGQSFDDVIQYKQLLLKDETKMAKVLARILLSYGLGRETEFSDREAIDRMVESTRDSNYGLRSLVHAVVQSPEFLKP